MSENEYFNDIKNKVNQLNIKQREELENFLGNMEQSWIRDEQTIKAYKNYIKRFKRQNRILFITFKTRNIDILAHICKYILDLEWNNEWALAVAGIHTRTIFGWFD